MCKKILKKIFVWIYPELKWFSDSNYDFSHLRTWQCNSVHGIDVGVRPVALHDDVQIGNHTAIGRDSIINHTDIGAFCTIGPNFFCGWGIHPTDKLSTSPHIYSTIPEWTVATSTLVEEHKPIHIGNDVFIGANVTVLENITIGDGAIIGAGAVVTRDIPPYAIAVGVPARVIKYRMLDHQIQALLRIKWWNWSDDKIVEVNKYFDNIDGFIEKYDV